MANGGSPINLGGDWAKPADRLVQKISDAVGGLARPFQIVRVAKAEAEAALIGAQSEIAIKALQRRAIERFVSEESMKQANMECITDKALPQLKDSASPEKIGQDWLTNFFDKARLVSDEELQQLWANILAGEANTPGTFSRRTVNLVGSLDKTDAEGFSRLMRFAWTMSDLQPLIFDYHEEIFQNPRIDFPLLTHLDDAGLISFIGVQGYGTGQIVETAEYHYFGQSVRVTIPNGRHNSISTGIVILTQAGRELARICEVKPVTGFFDYVVAAWKKAGLHCDAIEAVPHLASGSEQTSH